MSWRDRLRPASFRGVPFKVETPGWDGGRRLAAHEYAGRDDPFVEDLGRKGRRYNVTGYVLGDDYEALRDNLIEALEKKGDGTLVLPTVGALTVAPCDSYSLQEQPDEGGMCRFDLSFLQQGGNKFPAATTDTVSIVASVAAAAKADFAAAFAPVFKVLSYPAFVAEEAAKELSDLGALLSGLRQGPEGVLGDLAAARVTLAATINKVIDDPLAFVFGSMPDIVDALVSGFRSSASDTGVATSGLRDVAAYGASLVPVTGSTPSRLTEAVNTAAVSALIVRTSLTEQAIAASLTDFDAYDDAAALRARLCGDIGAAALVAADAGDGASFRALKKLSAAVSADLTARGGSLARIVTYDRAVSLPAAVLAYTLYGDAGRADELVKRNKAVHPLFMPLTGSALSS